MNKVVPVFICLLFTIPCQARIITVDNDGPADFSNIQAAINDANHGDIIEVLPGTYTGAGNRDIDFLGKAITIRSIDPNDPNVVASTVIDCGGQEEQWHRGFYFLSGEDDRSVLAGLTITNARLSIREFPEDLDGGGILCLHSSPTIFKCSLVGNSVEFRGGGMYCEGGNPIIRDCTFRENNASSGAGICFRDSSPVISGCDFIDNNSVENSGGIRCRNGNPRISDCWIIQNRGAGIDCDFCDIIIRNCIISRNTGGGINLFNGPTTITNCSITDNTAFVGAGIYAIHMSKRLRITNCLISGNSAGRDGGGIYCVYGGQPTIVNCLFTGNRAPQKGGGIFLKSNHSDSTTIINCTFAGNWALRGSSLGCEWGTTGPIEHLINNSILWDSGDIIYLEPGATLIVKYSDVRGGYKGINIKTNPQFVKQGYWANANDANLPVEPNDPKAVWVEGSYHLRSSSPCINRGSNRKVPADLTDVDGDGNMSEAIPWDLSRKPRIQDGRVDMGAYEFNHFPVANAGEDQIVYASHAGIAEVTLDGTNSYDDEGQSLTYKWSWTVDSNTYDINGVSPTIELPLGEHIIKLTVNDGLDDSEPDQVVITVAMQMQSLLIVPREINRQSENKTILALVRLPKGVTKEQVNMEKPLQFFPGGIEALSQHVIGSIRQGVQYTNIYSLFDKDELMLAIPDNGSVELHVVGWLMDGTIFRGRDVIKITHEVNVTSAKYGKASNPSPADGATFVSMTADLSWTLGSHAISHNVYFGRSRTPPFVCNQTSTTFDPGTMDNNTTYYWRIDEVSKWGITTGDIWTFKTMYSPPPPPFPHPPP
jgi:hypothetical protein